MTEKKIINLPAKYLPIVPLTRQEIHDAGAARLALITKEFADGFNFLKDYPKSVTFFGSARYKENDFYCEDVKVAALARAFGTPLYVYSYKTLIDHFRKLKTAFRAVNPLICYSVKANSNLSIFVVCVAPASYCW